MALNISPLEQAFLQLKESLKFLDCNLEQAFLQLGENLKLLGCNLAETKPAIKRTFERSAIQAFEFTYEISVKMIERQMKEILPIPNEINRMPFRDLMREVASAGLIPDVERFVDYRDKRNDTSHHYDENRASAILSILGEFSQDIQFLLDRLEERNS